MYILKKFKIRPNVKITFRQKRFDPNFLWGFRPNVIFAFVRILIFFSYIKKYNLNYI